MQKTDSQGYMLYSVNDVLRTAMDYDGRKKWIAAHKSKLIKIDGAWWGRASIFGKHRAKDMKDSDLGETYSIKDHKENELPPFYDPPKPKLGSTVEYHIPKMGDLLGHLRILEEKGKEELKHAEVLRDSLVLDSAR